MGPSPGPEPAPQFQPGGDGPSADVTEILRQLADGRRDAVDRLTPVVYRELHDLAAGYMRRERRDHTLQATALVHEAYCRLVDQTRVEWQGRAHFLAVASQAMRRILVDYARAKNAEKRGQGWQRVSVAGLGAAEESTPFDLLDLDDALAELAEEAPRRARLVEMRYFAGLSLDEIAEVLEISRRTAFREWRLAQMDLYVKLSDGEDRPADRNDAGDAETGQG